MTMKPKGTLASRQDKRGQRSRSRVRSRWVRRIINDGVERGRDRNERRKDEGQVGCGDHGTCMKRVPLPLM